MHLHTTITCTKPAIGALAQRKAPQRWHVWGPTKWRWTLSESPCCPRPCRAPGQETRYIKSHIGAAVTSAINKGNDGMRCSPSDGEWGFRSCRHRSPSPLSVPRQPGNWSSPCLRVSVSVCRCTFSLALCWCLDAFPDAKPLTSSKGRPLLTAGLLPCLFLSLSTGSVLFWF